MCLHRSNKATKKFFEDNRDKEEIVVWKVYEEVAVSFGHTAHMEIRPPFGHVFGDDPIQPGWVRSDRGSQQDDRWDSRRWWRGTEINRGIHVCLTKKAATELKKRSFFNGIHKIFKCTANIDDLVAVSRNKKQAVFMKIHITPEELEYGTKGKN